tara:strand:- start:2280 stop:2645 length:366 start_codon:yes stop_codon:yes gene_type:complete
MLSNILFVFFGGAIGAIARFLINLNFPKVGGFPISTLVVNIFGSLFFGFIYNLSSFKNDNWVHYFLLAGFAGAFTTFSTFAFETVQMFRNDNYTLGILNLVLNNLLCVICILLGMKISEAI